MKCIRHIILYAWLSFQMPNVPPLPPLEEPAVNSSILIEHGCGTKQINMTID